MSFETIEIKMAVVSAKKSVHTGFYSVTKEVRWLLIKSDVSGPLFGSDESTRFMFFFYTSLLNS